jgi:hypothetical protein
MGSDLLLWAATSAYARSILPCIGIGVPRSGCGRGAPRINLNEHPLNDWKAV